MKQFNCKQLVRGLGVALISTTGLIGLSTTPAHASFFPQQNNSACMAEQAGFGLNCTANDVRVSKVDNITNVDGTTPVECVLGELFTFKADVTITTTANERYDYSVYLPEGSWSAQDYNTDNTCSVLIGRTDGPGVDLEGGQDACADISKAAGFSPTHLYAGETITMFCRDDDNSGQAEFNYCAAWHNKDGADCSEFDPAAPGTPSKCRCDAFDIDVFIRPDPPAIEKARVGVDTHTEPGGAFTFTVSFTNPNDSSSIYLQSLEDLVDTDADGSYESTLNLWGATGPAGAADGVYLTSSNCSQPANGGEIGPSATYSCQFTVEKVGTDLPDDQSPKFYNDVVRLLLWDEKGDPVSADRCPAGVDDSLSQDCSDVEQVNLTNLPPTISVLKTASPTQVSESGADVTYTIDVTNTSDYWDSPLYLTELMDDQFGNLAGQGSCNVNLYIAEGATYSCSFTQFISGTGAGSHTNTVTAKATDNELDEATAAESETVLINDIPSAIALLKTANPTEVLETGDDPSQVRTVDFTFTFSVDDTGVDSVAFETLIDDQFGNLTGLCMVDMYDDGDDGNGTVGPQPIASTPLAGFILYPGESASCTISEDLTGNAGDIHVNVATITGTDEDGQAVEAVDDATVTFLPGSPAADMKFAASMLVVIELQNAGIENVTLTSLTLGIAGPSVFTEDATAGYRLYNTGGMFDGVSYPSCNQGEELTYNGSPGDTYACAFTIEFIPGLENTAPIEFLNEVIATVEDDEGDASSNDVSIQVTTVE